MPDPSSLRAVAATIERPMPGAKCVVATLRASLAADDRAYLDELLADRLNPASYIVRVLRTFGKPIGDQSINRHRRGACACPR